MPVSITCETSKGGAATLGKDVTVSYAVASVADLPPSELFYAWVKLPNGKTVSLFINRETGLVVVDVMRKDERGGNEILRTNANQVKMPSARELGLSGGCGPTMEEALTDSSSSDFEDA